MEQFLILNLSHKVLSNTTYVTLVSPLMPQYPIPYLEKQCFCKKFAFFSHILKTFLLNIVKYNIVKKQI